MTILATIAIPVLNGTPGLESTLARVRAQRIDGELELLICDSGSQDGSVSLARRYGARVIEIAPTEFGHGRTRNLLMEESRGDYVAFLTQDAVPEQDGWLAELLSGFGLGDRVGLTFGPYRPRPEASPMVARELTEWFGRLSPDGSPRVERLEPGERGLAPRELLGARGFFTDANGCIWRQAWREVPFRDIPYAEDHLLAHDMLRAGFAKVFLPTAAVTHSHDYSAWGWLRRSFDEARAVSDIYGWREPPDWKAGLLNLYGAVGADRRWGKRHGMGRVATSALLVRSTVHHAVRLGGAALGSRHERLAPGLVRRLSLEGRGPA